MLTNEIKQRVLLVNLTASCANALTQSLAGQQVEIISTIGLRSACDLIAKNHYSLIFIETSVLDGAFQFRELSAHSANKDIPLIALIDANHQASDTVDWYAAGMTDLIVKPVIHETLVAKAKVYLELSKNRALVQQQNKELGQALKRLQHYVQHDQLTQLYNREQLINILSRLMANARRRDDRLGVLMVDLDHFKHVNDSLGHDVGDQLLKKVADRIIRVTREGDFVARIGGDEFVIVLSNLPRPESAGDAAQKLLKNLEEVYRIGAHEIHSSSSIGIALFEKSLATPQELLKSADSAMYQAKRKGRNQFAYFSEDIEKQALKKIEMSNGLSDAIERNELSVYYQAQVSSTDLKITGFEALLRWQRNGEWVSPADFIPIAEETGLIPKIGEWVLRESCKDLKEWQDQGLMPLDIKVSVNISNKQLQASNFLIVLNKALKDSGLNPSCLELELTESTVMEDPESTISLFKEIHKLGVEIAIDDFGTGYSSLSYLKRLPLDTIKIDRAFVKDIRPETNDETIVQAIIGLSHNLGYKVVAEGVETDVQSEFLRRHECNTLQGFLYSRPVCKTDFKDFFSQYERQKAAS